MSEVTRRDSLKTLAMGAAIVLTPLDAHATADVADVAADRMLKGHSCAQAVFSAAAEQSGIDHDTAARIAAAFGGGMYLGSVCGAVTGGLMALGAKFGGQAIQAQLHTAKLGREFAERFKALHGSINCPDLLGGVDLSKIDLAQLGNPDQLKAAATSKLFANCQTYVRDGAAIVNELLTSAH
jgi:C_GCAxxG_C_C family probable redox protein